MATSAREGVETSISAKRPDYISWDEYFMATALLSAQRSKDPDTQVGATIVNDKMRIVGVGYNGFPNGCSDDSFPWRKNKDDSLKDKRMYVCHAEMNAILNKNSATVEGCTIYVTLFPCNECAKMIIQSGIKKVVYLSEKKDRTKASKRLLTTAGVKYKEFIQEKGKIILDFSAKKMLRSS